eukprot:1374128-Pyramimonas_sp.AAC.1
MTREPLRVGLALLGADLRLELDFVGGIEDQDLDDGAFAPGDPGAQDRRLEGADPLVLGGPHPEALHKAANLLGRARLGSGRGWER